MIRAEHLMQVNGTISRLLPGYDLIFSMEIVGIMFVIKPHNASIRITHLKSLIIHRYQYFFILIELFYYFIH